MRRIILLLVAVGVLMALTGGVVGAETATVRVGGTYEHGRFLVGANGMTLYIFTVDERGKSNCFGKCAEARPPLTVAEGSTPTAGPGIPGKLATIARTDGSPQVTYNGWPLYYWFRDAAVGDSTGHGVGNVWWVMKTDTVATGRNSQLGELVAGETGMTLYIFLKDEVGKSNCTGNCASAWPPLTVAAGASPSRGASVSGRLGAITRDDGSRQITYNGWPLYYWINDAKPGDTTGQNVGNV